MHHTRQNLEERYSALGDLRRRSLGLPNEPKVCRVCYAPHDEKGCWCGRNSWTIITIVHIELGLLLDSLHREDRVCTGERGCRHCAQVA